mgnify:CR=1 FL=1
MLSNKKVKKDNIEEEKKIAEKLNEAISKAEEEKADEDLADDELTLAEELSTDIAVRLADVTAQRFAEITGDAINADSNCSEPAFCYVILLHKII